MSEEQSYEFDFQRVTRFFDDLNIKFKLQEMNSSNNFEIVFSTYSADNIDDCISASGTLNSNVTIPNGGVVDCSLNWDGTIISVRNDVTWNIGDNNYSLKAVFVRNKANGYVMGYSININSFEVTNEVVIGAGTLLWSIQDGQFRV